MENFLSTVTILPWCKIKSASSPARAGDKHRAITQTIMPTIKVRASMMQSPEEFLLVAILNVGTKAKWRDRNASSHCSP